MTLPRFWFVYPNAVSVLWTSAPSQITFPPSGPPLIKQGINLSAFVNSPGLPGPGYEMCQGTWSFPQQSVTDPISNAIDTVNEWCSDHWWICITIPVGCQFFCPF